MNHRRVKATFPSIAVMVLLTGEGRLLDGGRFCKCGMKVSGLRGRLVTASLVLFSLAGLGLPGCGGADTAASAEGDADAGTDAPTSRDGGPDAHDGAPGPADSNAELSNVCEAYATHSLACCAGSCRPRAEYVAFCRDGGCRSYFDCANTAPTCEAMGRCWPPSC